MEDIKQIPGMEDIVWTPEMEKELSCGLEVGIDDRKPVGREDDSDE